MSIKPILFNTDMVRAILDERKTQTRRVVKGAKSEWCYEELSDDVAVIAVDKYGMEYAKPVDGLWATFEDSQGAIEYPMVKAPCRPGNILYVRETWAVTSRKLIDTLPDGARYWSAEGEGPQRYVYKAGFSLNDAPGVTRWHPSIHMPKEAARIFLRVTDVRVERLQEITEEDAEAEGFRSGLINRPSSARTCFYDRWDDTIKPADREHYGWAANPWVWVIAFERCEKPGI